MKPDVIITAENFRSQFEKFAVDPKTAMIYLKNIVSKMKLKKKSPQFCKIRSYLNTKEKRVKHERYQFYHRKYFDSGIDHHCIDCYVGSTTAEEISRTSHLWHVKTLLGFQVLSAGSSIIVGSLTYFGKIFTEGFHMQGIIPSIESINGQAMNDLGLGRDIALTFLAILYSILFWLVSQNGSTFLTGQAILWMATMTTVFGYFAGLRGIVLILVGGFIGACFAIAMPAVAQPIIRKITGSNDIAFRSFLYDRVLI